MNARRPRRAQGAGVLARVALGLYPPAWRARYGDEVQALLEDSGAGVRAAASLAWHAVPAWAWPARHLHDRPGRMRASLATTGMAWALLAGLAAVFVQLAQAQGSSQALTLARHPVIQGSYWVFDGAVIVSVLAVAAGGLPLWVRMARDARGADRRPELAGLLAPAVVPVVFVAASTVIVGLARRPGVRVVPWQARPVADLASGMIGPWWFLALVVAGLAAAAVSAAGPAVALRRLRPDGRAVVLATRAAGLAAAAMGLAGAASIVAAVGLYLWAPADAGYHVGWQLAVYLPAVSLAAAVAIISSGRGLRAAREPAVA
ncbi:MAG TPA: hypothetical protein VMU95_18085 [Trebonia sp.]|nr:hypothetical protein [Trebonia sp.]